MGKRRTIGNKVKNKLDAVFQSGKPGLLNVYCTAGYPRLNSTGEVIKALQQHGADMIEIGMPYSDPVADGPVIQESNMQALDNGMTMELLFAQLIKMKDEVHVPVILMGYLNPVLQYGMERFCFDAEKAGIAAVIIPDLPMYEYAQLYLPLFQQHRLHFIFLVTPDTDKKRLKKADGLSSGFLYAVSSASTTGQDNGLTAKEDYFLALREAKLRNPVLIGFGIKDKAGFQLASQYASGAIIGSAYIKAIKKSADIEQDTKAFLGAVLH
jgi:tryptophan synthase alpha chain